MLNTPILAILRGTSEDELIKLLGSFAISGIDTLEITMNTKDAKNLIERAIEVSDSNITVGAGTVTNRSELDIALNAGAQFIVTPVVNKDVIKACVNSQIPVIPGALTPTEIFTAWELGAYMVKVFPASVFGPKYFKDMLGPLDKIKLMAVGGVNDENISEYFKAGAAAVAIGGSLMSKDRLENNQYNLIEKDVGKLIQAIP